MDTSTGKVKFFNNEKGYGFITPNNGNSDIFVHISSVKQCGYTKLDEGDQVEFTAKEGRAGKMQADFIKIIT